MLKLIVILFILSNFANAQDKCSTAVNFAIKIINDRNGNVHPSDFPRDLFGLGGGRAYDGIHIVWLQLNKNTKYRSCKKNITLEFRANRSFNMFGEYPSNNNIPTYNYVKDINLKKISINPDGGKYDYNYYPERNIPLKLIK